MRTLTDGAVGLATWKAISQFDDVAVTAVRAATAAARGQLADVGRFRGRRCRFFETRTGTWDVTGGRYLATPSGDAVTTLRTATFASVAIWICRRL